MKGWKYYPMAMHLHCGHQRKASMESHIYNAASLGMEYIRFTPHDTRTGPLKNSVRSFDFARGEMEYKDESGFLRGWIKGENSDVSFETGAMNLTLQAPETTELFESNVQFYSQSKRHCVSLLAEVILNLELTAKTVGDACVVLDVELSQRPPDHETAHIFYCLSENADDNDEHNVQMFRETVPPHTAVVALPRKENGKYCLRISEDAQKFEEIVGGLDNAFLFLYIRVMARNGGSACCRVHKLDIDVRKGFEEVIAKQRKLGDEIGARYGVKPFITAEISGAGQHKNYYSEAVPVIDYAAAGYNVTQADAIAHVKKHGGIFCYNHPFENNQYKKKIFTPEQIKQIVEKEAASMAASRIYGATLMEVGFPQGRGIFPLEAHLRLWDLLSLAGVFVTGCGDSDSHCSDEGWFTGNNFATWIAAEPSMEFPISDEVFIESMKAGRAYCADPVWLKAEVELTENSLGVPMGAILTIEDRDRQPRFMTFRAQEVRKDWRIRIVTDGEVAEEYIIEKDGDFQCCFGVEPLWPVSFARVEMYNGEGRCILLTNPIYLVRTAEYAGDLPIHRLYGKGQS